MLYFWRLLINCKNFVMRKILGYIRFDIARRFLTIRIPIIRFYSTFLDAVVVRKAFLSPCYNCSKVVKWFWFRRKNNEMQKARKYIILWNATFFNSPRKKSEILRSKCHAWQNSACNCESSKLCCNKSVFLRLFRRKSCTQTQPTNKI